MSTFCSDPSVHLLCGTRAAIICMVLIMLLGQCTKKAGPLQLQVEAKLPAAAGWTGMVDQTFPSLSIRSPVRVLSSQLDSKTYQFQRRPTPSQELHRCETEREGWRGNHSLSAETKAHFAITNLLQARKNTARSQKIHLIGLESTNPATATEKIVSSASVYDLRTTVQYTLEALKQPPSPTAAAVLSGSSAELAVMPRRSLKCLVSNRQWDYGADRLTKSD